MDLKVRYENRFPINSSPQLYQYISTPSVIEWFADNVILEVSFFIYME
jgi:hypothetical protein